MLSPQFQFAFLAYVGRSETSASTFTRVRSRTVVSERSAHSERVSGDEENMQPLFFCKPSQALGRWAVGPLVAAYLIPFCFASSAYAQQQSSAGEWKPSYKWTQGTSSGQFGGRTWTNYGPLLSETFAWNYSTASYDDSPYDYRETQSPIFDSYNSSFANSFSSGTHQSGSSAGSASATAAGIAGYAQVDGQIQVTWKWVPRAGYNNAGPVPPTLNFVVRASATATANSRVDSNTVAMVTRDLSKESGEASVGLSDGGGVKDPITAYGSQWTAKGAKFYSIDTNGSSQISVDPITLHAKGSVVDGRSVALPPISTMGGPRTPYKDDMGQVSANVSVSAELNDHWVSISSPTIEPSYYKGSFPLLPVLHDPDANGAKNADSVVHLSEGLWQTGALQFNANLAGKWNNPYFDWSSAGDSGPAIGFNLADISQEHRSSVTTAFNLGSDGRSFPKSSNVEVTATDTDGSVADNSFNIKWHLRYEKTTDLPDGPPRRELYWVSQNRINPGDEASAEIIPPRTFDINAAIDGVLVLADIAGAPGASELGKIFEIITGVSEFLTTEEQIDVKDYNIGNNPTKFRDVVRNTPENISGIPTDTTAWRNYSDIEIANKLATYNCYVGRVRIHHKESTLGDEYNIHGYVRPDAIISHDVTDSREFQTFYQSKTTAPNPPALGDAEIPTSYHFS